MILSDVWRLSIAYIGPKSRTERPRKNKISKEVAHVTRDVAPLSRSKGQRSKVTGAGAYCGGLPHSLFAFICMEEFFCLLDCDKWRDIVTTNGNMDDDDLTNNVVEWWLEVQHEGRINSFCPLQKYTHNIRLTLRYTLSYLYMSFWANEWMNEYIPAEQSTDTDFPLCDGGVRSESKRPFL